MTSAALKDTSRDFLTTAKSGVPAGTYNFALALSNQATDQHDRIHVEENYVSMNDGIYSVTCSLAFNASK